MDKQTSFSPLAKIIARNFISYLEDTPKERIGLFSVFYGNGLFTQLTLEPKIINGEIKFQIFIFGLNLKKTAPYWMHENYAVAMDFGTLDNPRKFPLESKYFIAKVKNMILATDEAIEILQNHLRNLSK